MPRTRVSIPLRWSDMDAYGHVNNVQFLRLLEEARIRVFGRESAESGLSTALIVGRTEIEYLSQLVFSERPVAVDMWVTAIGGADFDLGYEFTDPEAAGEGRQPPVIARAESMQVVYDIATARPRRLTAEERERLEGMRDEPIVWRRRRKRPAT